MKITKKGEDFYRFELERSLLEEYPAGYKASDVIDFIYGTPADDYYTDVRLTRKYFPTVKTEWWQRLNKFWFVPLYCLTIPFQYIIRGDYKWDKETKVAKLATFLIGDE